MAYLGAKGGAGVYQLIIGLMPPHDDYWEPFAGSATIFRLKPAAARSILVDKDTSAAPIGEPTSNVDVIEGCGIEFLASTRRTPGRRLLIYADPPYPWSTRTSAARYRHELDDDGHRRLAEALQAHSRDGAMVIVSSYPNALYDELYAGWSSREFQAMTRGGVRTEKVWFNFTPGAVHWATFAGRDFTDRQRIKRKAARWRARFDACPPAERQAILAALIAPAAQSAASMAAEKPPANIDAAGYEVLSAGGIDEPDYGARCAPCGRWECGERNCGHERCRGGDRG